MRRKRKGFALDIKTFQGKDGQAYLIFRSGTGSFHAFVEVEAKEAARQCGAVREGNTRRMWSDIWQTR